MRAVVQLEVACVMFPHGTRIWVSEPPPGWFFDPVKFDIIEDQITYDAWTEFLYGRLIDFEDLSAKYQ